MGAIWGIVIDGQGRVVEGATVVLEPANRQAVTDASGGFRFEGLPGGTQFSVHASKGAAQSQSTKGRIESRVPYRIELRLVDAVVPTNPRPGNTPPGAKATTEQDVSQLVVMIRGVLGDAGEVLGAGIIVGRSNGRIYIATADHVVRRANDVMKDVKVSFKWLPGETTPGQVTLDHDSRLDLAVVMVLGGPELPADQGLAVIGAPPARKDTVFTIGHPNGQPWFIGVAPDTVVDTVGDTVQFQSVFLAPGNSGGALVNARSQLVGLVTQDDPPLGRALRIQSVLDRLRPWRYPIALSDAR